MAHSSNDYQRVYLRISRANPEQKESVKNAMHDVLKAHLEYRKFCSDLEKREKTTKPFPIDPTFKLTEHNLQIAHTKISAEPNGVFNPIVETVMVDVPKENKLDILVPFYRDIAVEFYAKYKTVPLETVEELVLNYQNCTFKDLQYLKEYLTSNKEYLIYCRLTQEKHKALLVLEESLGLKGSQEKLRPYGRIQEKQDSLWLLCMKKLLPEGYEFFSANLASNEIVNRAVDLAEYLSTEEYGKLTKEEQVKYLLRPRDTEQVATARILGNPDITPQKETNSSNGYKTRKDPIIIDSRKELTTQKETLLDYVYTKHRAQEIQKCLNYRKWRESVEHITKKLIEGGAGPYAVKLECRNSNLTEDQTREVMAIYESLVEEGVRMVLSAKPVEQESNITIEAESDSNLQQTWLNCMALRSGAPNSQGEIHDTIDFDTAKSECDIWAFKNTGKMISPENFEKAKKFWAPGYWYNHKRSEGNMEENTK